MAVLGKIFRLFDELLGGAACSLSSKLQLLRERVQFELGADSFHTDHRPEYHVRTHFSRIFGRAKFSKLSFQGLLVLPCLLEICTKGFYFIQ